MATVIVPDAKLDPFNPEYSNDLHNLAVNSSVRGATIVFDPETNEQSFGINDSKITISLIQTILTLGADVLNKPMWFKINSFDDEVPEELVSSSYVDEENNAVKHTWKTWAKPNNIPIEIDSQLYLGTNAHTGSYLKASEIAFNIENIVLNLPKLETKLNE